MSRMRFCVMDVGQGSANFVQYFDSDSPTAIAKNAGIIDIGSEAWKTRAGKPSAALIAQELLKMDSDDATLDEIMLSHSDSDHHNLIPALLDFFYPPDSMKTPRLTAKRTWFGGEYDLYTKGKTNTLDLLFDYAPTGSKVSRVQKQFEAAWSSFDDDDQNNWKPVAKIGGVELWVLAANTTGATVTMNNGKRRKIELNDRGDGYAINTKSLVVAAKFGGVSMIATGDATGLTLAHAVNVLERPGVKAKLGTVFMVTAPHHGSDSTTYSLLGGVRPGTRNWEAGKAVVERFVDDLAPQTVSASAGERRGFWHPSITVLADFSTHLLATPKFIDPVLALMKTDQHFYTAHFDADSLDWKPLAGTPKPTTKKRKANDGVPTKWPMFSGWNVARTAKNIFTTDYFYTWVHAQVPVAFPPEAFETENVKYEKPAPPPNAISWAFDVKNDGTTSVLVAFRREDLHPAHIAHVEAMLGTSLPDDEFIWVPSAELPPADDQPPADQPDEPPARDAVPPTLPRPAPPGLGNARQIS
jgi:beta-lactamase superfamily II metal-dependent hydrolase